MSWDCGLTIQKHKKLFPFWGFYNTHVKKSKKILIIKEQD